MSSEYKELVDTLLNETVDGVTGELKRNPVTNLLISDSIYLSIIGVTPNQLAYKQLTPGQVSELTQREILKKFFNCFERYMGLAEAHGVLILFRNLSLITSNGDTFITPTIIKGIRVAIEKIRKGIIDSVIHPNYILDMTTQHKINQILFGYKASTIPKNVLSSVIHGLQSFMEAHKNPKTMSTCEPKNLMSPVLFKEYWGLVSTLPVRYPGVFNSNKGDLSSIPIPSNELETINGFVDLIKFETGKVEAIYDEVYGCGWGLEGDTVTEARGDFLSANWGGIENTPGGIAEAVECCLRLGVVEDGDFPSSKDRRIATKRGYLVRVVNCKDRNGDTIEDGTACTLRGVRYSKLYRLWRDYLKTNKLG